MRACLPSHPIDRTLDTLAAHIKYMRVNHGRPNVFVAKKLLNRADVVAIL